MSLKNIKFELNETQRVKRKELFESLLKEPEIIEFIETYQCPLIIVEENASRFKEWYLSKRRAHSYTDSQLLEEPHRGEYITLVYDAKTGILSEEFYQLPVIKEMNEERAYLSNFVIFDLPISFQHAQFESIRIESENPKYLSTLESMINFVDDDTLGHFIYGDLGVGKSYLSACVANDFAKSGRRVAFVHVPKLMNYLKQLFNSPIEMERVLRSLRNVSLLVLDDLGAETITSWSRDEILLSILNERLEEKRKTIITSNYSPELLEQLYQIDNRGTSDVIRARRLVDRIRALTNPNEMVGKNRRNG